LARRSPKPPTIPEAVRRAVEKTFQTTLGSAALTRERAQEIADDVLKGAEERAVRTGRGVRQVDQRRREVTAGVGGRVRDAIADLRGASVIDLAEVRSEVQKLRRRVDRLEQVLDVANSRTRERPKPASRASSSSRSQKTTGRRSASAKRASGSSSGKGGSRKT
jgi:polyhydroxyalkanoate synthesis regulator phasin